MVWPRAAMGGTTMGIVRRQLERLGAPQRGRNCRQDLRALKGAVVMNSWTPGVPLRRIGATDVPPAPSWRCCIASTRPNPCCRSEATAGVGE